MKRPSPGRPHRLRRPFKLVALGASALLLALVLACGAAEQHQEPATQAEPASQTSPAQPAGQPQAAAESATGAETGESMVKSENAMNQETGPQAEPATAKEMPVEKPASAEVVVENTAEVQPDPVVKALAPQAQPAAATAEPAAPRQEPASPAQPTEAEPAQVPEPTSEPVAAPQPTQAPAQQPTAVPAPQPTATPVAVVVEPLPEVGNQVGNRVPDIGLELLGGSMVSTSGLIEQGKPTFLFFTSTT